MLTTRSPERSISATSLIAVTIARRSLAIGCCSARRWKQRSSRSTRAQVDDVVATDDLVGGVQVAREQRFGAPGQHLDDHRRDDHEVVTDLIELVMKRLPLLDHVAILTSQSTGSGNRRQRQGEQCANGSRPDGTDAGDARERRKCMQDVSIAGIGEALRAQRTPSSNAARRPRPWARTGPTRRSSPSSARACGAACGPGTRRTRARGRARTGSRSPPRPRGARTPRHSRRSGSRLPFGNVQSS